MNELVTIIVPIYNVQDYLKDCLDSLLRQTHTELQILAVNDGSTDGSEAILGEYAAADQRITVLNKTNGGLSDARNYGLRYAKGKYVCFIDSDDWIEENYVSSMLKALIDHDADVACCDMQYVYEDGHTEPSCGGSFDVVRASEHPEYIRINNSACNKLFKTDLFSDVIFPKGKLYEDLATIPIILYQAGRIVKVNECLYDYRQRSGSIRHSVDRRIFHIYDAIDRVKDTICKDGNSVVMDEINHMYVIFGLDLTTLKIKDMERTPEREAMLKENMKILKNHYPDFMKDPYVKQAGMKKRVIFTLLALGSIKTVLKIYDR